MENGNSRKIGTALDFVYCSFSLCLPSQASAPNAEEGLLDFSVSLAYLVLALLESLPLCASGARLLERDLILVSLAFFISLPLRASGARLLERELVLVNTPLGPTTTVHTQESSRRFLEVSAMERGLAALAFAGCENVVVVGRRPTTRRIKRSERIKVF